MFFMNKVNILNPFGELVGLSFINEEKETEPRFCMPAFSDNQMWWARQAQCSCCALFVSSGGHRTCCQLWSPGARDSFGQFFNL